jgi:tetratricopeptide (TPR) repeat protein
MHADRYGDAEATAVRALSIGKDSSLLDATLFETALLQPNGPATARYPAGEAGKPDQWDLYELQALASAKDGKYKHAEELFRAAYGAAMRDNLTEKADDILIDQAHAEFEGGMSAAARATLRRVKQQPPSNPDAPILEAELGDSSLAERVLAAHSGLTDSDTLMTYVYGPQARAAIALNQAKPLQAVVELEPVAEYDYAAGFAVVTERAEAYLMAKQPEKAAFEYRKILDHPGVDPVSPLFPLARLGLARSESQMGDVDRSGADVDLPILMTARREYAGLIAARR